MKSIISAEVHENVKPFPKLMIAEDDNGVVIAYFESQHSGGTVVYTTDTDYPLMSFYDDFKMEIFTNFGGNVVLSND